MFQFTTKVLKFKTGTGGGRLNTFFVEKSNIWFKKIPLNCFVAPPLLPDFSIYLQVCMYASFMQIILVPS